MSNKRRAALVLSLLLLLVVFFWLRMRRRPTEIPPPVLPPPVQPSTAPVQVKPLSPRPVIPSSPRPPSPAPPRFDSAHRPELVEGLARSPALPIAPSTVTFVVPPGQEGMHRELIPKHITIVRCYYDLEIVAPGTTFGFDINGSGFDEAFYKIISIDPDALDVEVKNLRLVTANQIHGQIEAGYAATTQYIHPKVFIRGLPVFRAPEPFGVVRRGEVLDIQLTSIDESGQWGRFRVITNLDYALFDRFRIEPTDPRLEISNIKTDFPFYVDGVIMIAPGLSHGQYGLATYMGKRVLLKKDPIVDVVKPNVGRTGSVERVQAAELAHRPGDTLMLAVKGSGFTPGAVPSLAVRVNEFDMGPSSFTYLSPGKLQASFRIPYNAPVGVYSVALLSNGKTIYQQPSVFGIVPSNWVSAVKLSRPLSPGQSGQVLIVGREISPTFASGLDIATEEPGLAITGLRLQDPSTLVAEISVSTAVAPGDYLVHVTSQGKDLKLPKGNLIKINP